MYLRVYCLLMMSRQKNKCVYRYLCQSSAAVVTVHALPAAKMKMAPITQVFMIHISPAITVFYDLDHYAPD